MVEIEYKGGNSVVISSKRSKLVSDPKLSLVGLKDAAVKDAIEIVTEDRFAISSIDSDLIIHSPGEFGVEDFDIRGISAMRHIDTEAVPNAATIYRIEAEDIRIGLIGNIAPKLSEDQLEALGLIDILIIPIGGGGYTLDPLEAANLVREIGPKVVIPVHYSDPSAKYEMPQEDFALFEKEMNGISVETVQKYKVKQSFADQDTLKIIKVERH